MEDERRTDGGRTDGGWMDGRSMDKGQADDRRTQGGQKTDGGRTQGRQNDRYYIVSYWIYKSTPEFIELLKSKQTYLKLNKLDIKAYLSITEEEVS